ncbi:hypothetical protein, partial [Bartonella sp. CL9QHWL]|uniref:hypothetical protein n=1 Tax=Bartonella sp. CL9QHWL TaxID=3243542 RepID=UPI0035CF2805
MQLFAIHSSVEQYMQEHPVFRYSAAEMGSSIGVGQEPDYELDIVLERFERSASPDLHSDPEDILEQALAQFEACYYEQWQEAFSMGLVDKGNGIHETEGKDQPSQQVPLDGSEDEVEEHEGPFDEIDKP